MQYGMGRRIPDPRSLLDPDPCHMRGGLRSLSQTLRMPAHEYSVYASLAARDTPVMVAPVAPNFMFG